MYDLQMFIVIEKERRRGSSCRSRLEELIKASKIEVHVNRFRSSSDLFSTDECRQVILACLSRLGNEYLEFQNLSILEEACRLIQVMDDNDEEVCSSSSSSSSSSSTGDENLESLMMEDHNNGNNNNNNNSLCFRLNKSLVVLLEQYVSLKESIRNRKSDCTDRIIREMYHREDDNSL